MELTIQRDALLGSLTTAASVANAKGTIPILANVLLQVTAKDRLLVAASDISISYVSTVACESKGDFAVALDAKALLGIVKSLPGSSLTMKSAKGKVEIRAGKARFELGGLPAADFPRLPDTSSQVFAEVDAATLRFAVEATSFACTDTDGPLGGVQCHFGEDGRLIAADRARGAMARGKLGAVAMRSALVPRSALSQLLKAFDDASTVEVAVSLAELFVRNRDTMMVAKLLEAQFPATAEGLFRGDSDHDVTCDREQLIAAVRRVSLVTSREAKELGSCTKFVVSSDLLRISASGAGVGVASDEMEVSYIGDGFTRYFDARPLVEALESMHAEEVVLGVNDELMTPLTINPVGDVQQRALLMPMQGDK